MIKNGFDSFPVAHRDAARSALVAAFGAASVGQIATLAGGATTASVYRVDVGGRPYLLRIEGHPSPLRNPHQYESMRIAAKEGIAPGIHYVDEMNRIAIIDFIEQVPLKAFPGGRSALAQALGDLLSRVQSAPAFPYFVEYPDIVAQWRNTEIDNPAGPLFTTSKFSEGDIICETNCGTYCSCCSGSYRKECC